MTEVYDAADMTALESYLAAQGLTEAEINAYTDALDGEGSIDPALLSDPAFQAYWQLAYLQLLEIIDPATMQAVYADVGYDATIDEMYDSAQSLASEETNALIEQMYLDDPALAAELADLDGDASTSSEGFWAFVGTPPETDTDTSDSSEDLTDTDEYEMAEELGLDWDSYAVLVGTSEGTKSVETALWDELDNLMAAEAEALEAFQNGEITVDEYNATVQQSMMSKEFIFGMLGNLEKALGELIEAFSQMLKARQDSDAQLVQRLAV